MESRWPIIMNTCGLAEYAHQPPKLPNTATPKRKACRYQNEILRHKEYLEEKQSLLREVKATKKLAYILILIAILSSGISCSRESVNPNKTDSSPKVSTELEPHQETKNEGPTAIIISDTDLKSSKTEDSKTLTQLKTGNLIRVLQKDTAWAYVEPVYFVPPGAKGYIPAKTLSLEIKNKTPNQGFIIRTAKVHSQPDSAAAIINEANGPINIYERKKGWAFCSFTGGQLEGWIKESEIQYEFPAGF